MSRALRHGVLVGLIIGLLMFAGCSSAESEATTVTRPEPSPPTATSGAETLVTGSAAETVVDAASPTTARETAEDDEPANLLCDALVNVAADVDDEALGLLVSVVVEDNELVLPAALQVLSDPDAGSAARSLATVRLAGLVGATECELPDPPESVLVDAAGVWLGSPGESPVLVAPFDLPRPAVVGPVTLMLGAPIVDTGPIEPFSVYGTCGGEQLWAVEWPGLVLLFSDDGNEPESFDLSTWRLYRQEGVVFDDDALLPATTSGVGLGSTLDEVIDVFPTGVRFFDELASADAVSVDDQLLFIAGGEGAEVTFVEAGFVCGE